MPAQKPPTADDKLESFHLWTGEDREPGFGILWFAGGAAVTILLGLAYLARAVL
jgi:hypothetical protein